VNEQTNHRRWHVFASIDELIDDRTAAITSLANEIIASGRDFRLVVSGGRTPVVLFQRLAKIETDWSHWHIYFADERCLPTGHVERNDTQARVHWLHRVDIPEANIHAIPAERGPEAAATAYAATLEPVAMFDLVLLGIGEDGHTASLFPGDAALDNFAAVIGVTNSPKPPPRRVTLGAARLSRANRVWFIVTGADKLPALRALQAGDDIPAARISAARGVDVFTDCVTNPTSTPNPEKPAHNPARRRHP
jgi:6-phosphogluconolactonase